MSWIPSISYMPNSHTIRSGLTWNCSTSSDASFEDSYDFTLNPSPVSSLLLTSNLNLSESISRISAVVSLNSASHLARSSTYKGLTRKSEHPALLAALRFLSVALPVSTITGTSGSFSYRSNCRISVVDYIPSIFGISISVRIAVNSWCRFLYSSTRSRPLLTT